MEAATDSPALWPVHEIVEVLYSANQDAPFASTIIDDDVCNRIGIRLRTITVDLDLHVAYQVIRELELRNGTERFYDGFPTGMHCLAAEVLGVHIRREAGAERGEVSSVETVEILANHVADGVLVEQPAQGKYLLRREIFLFHGLTPRFV